MWIHTAGHTQHCMSVMFGPAYTEAINRTINLTKDGSSREEVAYGRNLRLILRMQ